MTLKWALLNALSVVLLTVLAIEFHNRIHGVALAVVPVILLVGAYASSIGGRLCWRADNLKHDLRGMRHLATRERSLILHEAQYLEFFAWVCQMAGILSTVIGFFILISSGGDVTNLGNRIQSGGGTALLGTFVGVFVSLILALEHRLIEHDLGTG
jgi:hypothetical protein